MSKKKKNQTPPVPAEAPAQPEKAAEEAAPLPKPSAPEETSPSPVPSAPEEAPKTPPAQEEQSPEKPEETADSPEVAPEGPSSAPDAPPKEIPLTPQQQLRGDPLYRRGRKVYVTGLIITAVFLLANTARYFLEIELILGGGLCTPYLYFLVIIPAAIMITGVAMTEKACRKYGVKEENKTLIGFISVCTALIIALGVVNIVKPPKKVYTSTDYELRPGQTLTAMEYVEYGLMDEPRPNLPPDHRVAIYKTWGPFGQLVASDDVFYGSYEIQTADGDNNYKIHVISMSKDEWYPFTY